MGNRQTETQRARHDNLKAAGRCVRHKDRPAVPGRTVCQECLDYGKAYRRSLKGAGRCSNHKDRPAVPGRTVCQECLDYGKARYKARYKAYKKAGKCWCGDPVIAGGTRCAKHYWEFRGYTLRRRKATDPVLDSGETLRLWFEAQVKHQSGRCVCGVELVNDCIDHDHETGLLRGLLCNPCNKIETYIGISDMVRVHKLLRYTQTNGDLAPENRPVEPEPLPEAA